MGFYSSFFYIMICWPVFKILISSFYLHIWFPDADDNQTVTNSLLQNPHVDSNPRQSSGMAFYTSLRVLTLKEQHNK